MTIEKYEHISLGLLEMKVYTFIVVNVLAFTKIKV